MNTEYIPSQRGALAGLSLCVLLSSLGTSIANVGLPALAQAFGAPFQEVQWVILAYLLSVTTMVVSAGRLGDIVGRRRLLLGGTALFTVASLLCGLAPTLWLLVAARGAQGVGAAVMMSLSLALVAGPMVPKTKAGRVMGLLGTMSAIGTALGPSLGGALIAWIGWRSLFLLNLPLGVLAVFLMHHGLPVDTRHDRPGGFDYAGTLLLGLALAAYALAMTTGRGHFGPRNATLLIVAVFAAGLFLLAQRRAASPLFQLSMFRDLGLTGGLAMSALVATVMMATMVVGPFYLSRALELDTAMVGIVLSAGPIVAALSGLPAGRMVDGIGPKQATTMGLLAMAGGSGALSVLPVWLGVAGYLVPIVVMTAGYGLFQTANNTAVMVGSNPEQGGVLSGLLGLSRNFGLITGASVMGSVFVFASAATDITTAGPEVVASGMRATFAVATILLALALATAVRFRGSGRFGDSGAFLPVDLSRGRSTTR